MRIFETILRHLTVVLSMMFLVFLVLDQFNPMMNFVDNGISHGLLAALCICGILNAAIRWKADAEDRRRA